MQSVPVQRAIVAFLRAGIDSGEAVLSSLYSAGNGVVASAESGVLTGLIDWDVDSDVFRNILNKFPQIPQIVLPPLPP